MIDKVKKITMNPEIALGFLAGSVFSLITEIIIFWIIK
jgi:hypothetical protein